MLRLAQRDGQGERDLQEVIAAGRISERWRFTCDEEVDVALQSSMGCPLKVPETSGEAPQLASDYREVPATLFDGEWQVVSAGRWRHEECMPVLEGRALLWAPSPSLCWMM